MIHAVRSVRNCRRCCRVRPPRLDLLTHLSIADLVADRGGQIGPLACHVDPCNRLVHRRTLGLRDRLQAAPERIFETDAGLVAIDHDGAFDDLRFHGSPFELKAVLGSYRDSVPSRETRVLKITFAELLRSCSRNHRGAGL
jgi:hypothetical protein